LCATATSLNTLIVLRFIHGIGGGMLIPVGMTMIYRVYDKSEYASITSFTFLPSLIAPAIAPFLGGLLLDSVGWRFVFLFSGPICLVLALVSIIYLIEEPSKPTKPLDWLGFISSSAILIDTFYFLSTLAKNNDASVTAACVAILIPLVVFFIWWEKRILHPLIDLNFFKNETFIKANLFSRHVFAGGRWFICKLSGLNHGYASRWRHGNESLFRETI
jgi:MFS family permease